MKKFTNMLLKGALSLLIFVSAIAVSESCQKVNAEPNSVQSGPTLALIGTGTGYEVINIDGSVYSQISIPTNFVPYITEPQLLPSKTGIIFGLNSNAPASIEGIYTMNFDGTGLTRIMANTFSDSTTVSNSVADIK